MVLVQKVARRNYYKSLFYYYAIAVGIMIFAIIADQNCWIYNLYFFANITILSLYFRSIYVNVFHRKIVGLFMVINTSGFLYSNRSLSLFNNDINSEIIVLYFLSGVIFSLIYFYQILKNVTDKNILLNFDFWFVSGYLIYFLGAFFVVLYYNNLHVLVGTDVWKIHRGNMWMIHNIVLFISSVISFTGYLKIVQNQKSL